MKTFIASLRISFLSMLAFTFLLGIIYPLIVTGIGQTMLHRKANGSLIYDHSKKVIGSELIGQSFQQPEYFHPRPSFAGKNGYNAAQSSGSNLGPTSQKLIDAVKSRVAAYRAENELAADVLIPADAVMASGSGLDPHISVENAYIQASRIATIRGISIQSVENLIKERTEQPFLGLFGQKRINVLRINLDLDELP